MATYLDLPGTAGSYASTPDDPALDIVGDVDIRASVVLPVLTGEETLVAKWRTAGDQRSYTLEITATDNLKFRWSSTGADDLSATSTVPVARPAFGAPLAIEGVIDVNNGAGGRNIAFFTSTDDGRTWTQLGTTVTQAGVTSVFSSTSPLEIGRRGTAANTLTGRVDWVEVRSGFAGPLAARPEFRHRFVGDTTWVDVAGRTWTLNGDAKIVRTTDALGVFKPPGWGAGWRQALAEAGLRRVNVNIFGDSVSEGYGATDRWDKAWWGILRDALQARYGHGGSGYLSVVGSPDASLSGPSPIADTGVWVPGLPTGVSALVITTDPSATLTFGAVHGVRGVSIDLYHQPQVFDAHFLVTAGGRKRRVDNSPLAMDPLVPIRSEAFTDVDHERKVEIGWDPTSGAAVRLNGIDGRNDCGCAVHNLALWGMLSSMVGLAAWGGAPAGDVIGRYAIDRFLSPDLFIYGMMINDWHNAVSIATYEANVRDALTRARNRNSKVDIVIFVPHPSPSDPPFDNAIWPSYVNSAYEIAAEYGAAVVDMFERGQFFTNFVVDQGYLPASDPHPTDLGYAWYAEAFTSLIVADQHVPVLLAS